MFVLLPFACSLEIAAFHDFEHSCMCLVLEATIFVCVPEMQHNTGGDKIRKCLISQS